MNKVISDKLIGAMIIVGLGYVLVSLIGIIQLAILSVVIVSGFTLLKRRWAVIREQGIINRLSPKLRKVLLEKSVLDIFMDVIYFPYVSKIIGAYFYIAAAKPHPEQIQLIFKQLPHEVIQFSNRKGLLSLTPQIVQNMILPMQRKDLLPVNYGTIDKRWTSLQKYNSGLQKVHEQTLQKRIIHFVDGKVGWITVIGLLCCTLAGKSQMKQTQFKKMLIQNATFAFMILTLIALLIKIKRLTKHSSKKSIKQLQPQKQE